jgi:hypothetical protein
MSTSLRQSRNTLYSSNKMLQSTKSINKTKSNKLNTSNNKAKQKSENYNTKDTSTNYPTFNKNNDSLINPSRSFNSAIVSRDFNHSQLEFPESHSNVFNNNLLNNNKDNNSNQPEKYTNEALTEIYKSRLNDIFNLFQSLPNKILNDDVYKSLKTNPNTIDFITERMEEIIKSSITSEKEQQINNLQLLNSNMKQQLNQKESKIAETLQNMKQLTINHSNSTKEIEFLLKQSQEKNSLLKNEVISLTNSLNNFKLTYDHDIQSLSDDFISKVRELKNENSFLKEQNKIISEERLSFKDKNQILEAENFQNNKEIEKLKKINSVYEIDYNQNNKILLENNDKLSNLQDENEQLKNKLVTYEIKVSKETEENKNLKGMIKYYENERESLYQKYNKLENDTNNNVSHIKADTVRYKENYNYLQEEISNLKEEINSLISKNEELTKKLDISKNYNSKELKDLNIDIQSVTNSYKNKIRDLEIEKEEEINRLIHEYSIEINNLKYKYENEIENLKRVNKKSLLSSNINEKQSNQSLDNNYLREYKENNNDYDEKEEISNYYKEQIYNIENKYSKEIENTKHILTNKINYFEENISNLQNSNNNLLNDNKKLYEELRDITKSYSSLKDQIIMQDKELNNKNKLIFSKDSRIRELEIMLTNNNSNPVLYKIRNSLIEEKKNIENLKNDLINQINHIKKQNTNAISDIISFSTKLNDLNKKKRIKEESDIKSKTRSKSKEKISNDKNSNSKFYLEQTKITEKLEKENKKLIEKNYLTIKENNNLMDKLSILEKTNFELKGSNKDSVKKINELKEYIDKLIKSKENTKDKSNIDNFQNDLERLKKLYEDKIMLLNQQISNLEGKLRSTNSSK